jgi:hypothetical protein
MTFCVSRSDAFRASSLKKRGVAPQSSNPLPSTHKPSPPSPLACRPEPFSRVSNHEKMEMAQANEVLGAAKQSKCCIMAASRQAALRGSRSPVDYAVGRARTCATAPCPCGQAGMTMSRMGSRRAAESAVEMASAMVDSSKLTLVRPSFGVTRAGPDGFESGDSHRPGMSRVLACYSACGTWSF